jgi:hypothetical protein
MYNLDPYGTTTVNGVKVPVILCHYDSYKLGLGTNHGDVYHWFKKYGKTMDDVRRDVAELMKKKSDDITNNNTSVNASNNVSNNTSNTSNTTNKPINSTIASNIVTGVHNMLFNSVPYKVKVTASALNVRKGAGTKYDSRGYIRDKGIYTIVEEKYNGLTKWGLLKSYADNRDGWISLRYTKKV